MLEALEMILNYGVRACQAVLFARLVSVEGVIWVRHLTLQTHETLRDISFCLAENEVIRIS